MQRIECRLIEMNECAEHIWHVRLAPAQAVTFKPGQYLQVIMGDKDKRPFSIASSPTREGIELQIGAMPGNAYPGEVLERLRQTGSLSVEIVCEHIADAAEQFQQHNTEIGLVEVCPAVCKLRYPRKQLLSQGLVILITI